ncbi:ATP-binding protein [Granulicella tundricola]|uniref:histidine kinase n=1 Tax=Granulicella tundricola (strain ATCC BAA-1859 / DSM 23138 / MP5ACTX9) TaxID=1198114 RepID=E8X741_GRATM|nr:ATP-binding protein [Granulicella tundricola]ADW71275.1 multi-sensor signal transduction histidine kinase [Granulicella tundricola MP5ACTX9]
MLSAPAPDDDAERVATLHSYDILDTSPEEAYEDVTALATFFCETPYATITFVDKERQWFKSEAGFGVNETGRLDGFCACTILQPDPLIIEDTLLDSRFSMNQFVLDGPRIRFYAGAPIVAPNGHVLGTVCVFDDKPRQLASAQVSALKALARQVESLLEQRSTVSRLEAALKASQEAERRLGEVAATQQTMWKRLAEAAAIVDSSDDAILSKDLNGIITSWNLGASRVFGYTAQEMVGTSILRLIPAELHSDEAIIIGKVRAGERAEHFETLRLTKDGRRLQVSLTVSPIKDEQGFVIGASKILRDMSDRKRIEDSLLQAEKLAAAGRMASTLAHEVNNPLEAITNLLYLLRPLVTDIAGINYLTTAESEIARVSHIAKQTLGFYREYTTASPISLSELAQDAIKIYEPRCALKGIQILTSFQSDKILVLRRVEIMQVISNLITNSMYAMPSGGVLSLSVEDAASEGVIVIVQDTGVGIAAQNLPKMFEAFFTTRNAIGTGIGLFVVKNFVEGHGGRIEVESSQGMDDHGTSVRIYLPLRTFST